MEAERAAGSKRWSSPVQVAVQVEVVEERERAEQGWQCFHCALVRSLPRRLLDADVEEEVLLSQRRPPRGRYGLCHCPPLNTIDLISASSDLSL